MNFFLFFVFFIYSIDAQLNGTNVCFETKVKYVNVKEESTKVILKETLGWCLTRFPPRCVKKKQITIPQIKIVPHPIYEKVAVCCEGYQQVRNACVPICSRDCGHGKCVGPDECECVAGWAGSDCNITCAPGFFGPNCSLACSCDPTRASRCHPSTGICICNPGQPAVGCIHQCSCFNGGKCDTQTGHCDCRPGYSGRDCEAKCVTGSFGKDCASACDCLYNAGCDFVTGACQCLPGYSGPRCEDRNCSMVDCVSVNSLLKGEAEEERGSAAPIVVVACLLSLLVLVASLLLVLRNKKKIHELKNELAYVSYTVDRPTDRFDNPLYSAAADLVNPQVISSSSPPPPPPLNIGMKKAMVTEVRDNGEPIYAEIPAASASTKEEVDELHYDLPKKSFF